MSALNLKEQVLTLLPEENKGEVLLEVLTKLQGLRRFQVNPRILISPYSLFRPTIYAQNQLGIFEHVQLGTQKFLEAKYPTREVKTYSGKKYLTLTGIISGIITTEFFRISHKKKKLLFSVSGKAFLITVVDKKLVIEYRMGSKSKYELWSKEGSKFIKLYELNMSKGKGEAEYPVSNQKKNYDFIHVGDNSLLSYTPIKVVGDLIVPQNSKKEYLKIYRGEQDTESWDPIIMNSESDEIVTYWKNNIHVSYSGEVIQSFLVNGEGYLHKITRNLFVFVGFGYIAFYTRYPGEPYLSRNSLVDIEDWISVKGKWSLTQTLITLNVHPTDVLLILPPEKSDVIEKAKLLPFDLPLDLKVEVVEFCVTD